MSGWNAAVLLLVAVLGVGAYAAQLHRRLQRYERRADVVHVVRQHLKRNHGDRFTATLDVVLTAVSVGLMGEFGGDPEGLALALEALALELRKRKGGRTG
jgi:hypothetical protein